MRVKTIFIHILLIGMICKAQHTSNPKTNLAPQQNTGSDPRYDELFDEIRGMAPEYQSGIIRNIDLFGKLMVPVKKYEEALLNLFDSAERAHYESGMIYASNHRTDGRVAYTATVLRSNLSDRLDIQSNVVGILARYEPAVAAKEFALIRLPNKKATCNDAAVNDYYLYYQVLKQLYNNERVGSMDNQAKYDYLLSKIHESDSLERITYMIAIMPDLNLRPEQRQEVQTMLASELDGMQASDREMNAQAKQLEKSTAAFVNKLNSDQTSTLVLRKALRKFLVENMRVEACTDATVDREAVVSNFNDKFAEVNIVDAIQLSQVQPMKSSGAAQEEIILRYSKLDEAVTRVLDEAHDNILNHNDSQSSGQLTDDVQAIIKGLHETQLGDDCPSCLFHTRSAMYCRLVQSLPKGPQLEYAIEEYVSLLEFNQEETDDPPVYAGMLDWTMIISRPMSDEARKQLVDFEKKGFNTTGWKETDEKDYLRARLSKTSDPIIQTYLLYEELYKPEYKIH